MNKQEYIESYAMSLMALYSAQQYDYNCHVGWRDKERYMSPEDAYHLAEQAWERVQEYKINNPIKS